MVNEKMKKKLLSIILNFIDFRAKNIFLMYINFEKK